MPLLLLRTSVSSASKFSSSVSDLFSTTLTAYLHFSFKCTALFTTEKRPLRGERKREREKKKNKHERQLRRASALESRVCATAKKSRRLQSCS